MNICFIGKYPPIQGGVSRDNFWSSYALAQAGFEVHVVTNAQEVEYQFRIFEDSSLTPFLNSLKEQEDKGSIQVHYSSNVSTTAYIPWANPFVTKLAAIATEVVEKYGCDLIYSYYLEPYAVAAHLVSHWTGIPYGIRHAGSDVGRLFQFPELRTTYTRVLQDADYIFVSPNTLRRFLHLGVDWERLYTFNAHSLPTEYFCPTFPPLNVSQYLLTVKEHFPASRYQGIFQRFLEKPFDPSLPTIGIYGKTGQTKGSFDLLQALSKLHKAGIKFNFLALTQGHIPVTTAFAQAIQEYALEEVAWLLPFMPHWEVPRFIRACTVVCFLERDFSIPIHHPAVPREVLACGTCLILSREIAAKQVYKDRLADGSNVILVDPHNIDELATALQTVICNPQVAQEIGARGYKDVSSHLEDFAAYTNGLAFTFDTIFQDVRERRNLMSVSEMQACLARLYVNRPFRQLFHLNEDLVFQEYKLDDEERQVLKNIDKRMLDYFANSLINKRKKRFQSIFPLLNQVLGPEFERYYERYYHVYPAKPHEPTLQQVLDFGDFMEQCLAVDADVAPYAGELARYEKLCFSTKFQPSPQDTFATINEKHSVSQQLLDRSVCPLLSPSVQIAEFQYNVDKIASTLQLQQEPGDVQKGSYWMIFQQTDTTQPRIFSISPAIGHLLELCDGQHTLLDIIQIMQRITGRSNLESIIDRSLQDLHNLSIVGV